MNHNGNSQLFTKKDIYTIREKIKTNFIWLLHTNYRMVSLCSEEPFEMKVAIHDDRTV